MNKLKLISTALALMILAACGGKDKSTPNKIPDGQLQIDTSNAFYSAYRFTSGDIDSTEEWTVLEAKLNTLKPTSSKAHLELVVMCFGEGGPDYTVVRAELDRGIGLPDFRCFKGKPERKNQQVRFRSANEDISLLRGHTTDDYQPGVTNYGEFHLNFVKVPDTFDAVFTGANSTTKKTYLYRTTGISAAEDELIHIDFTDSDKVTELNTQEYIYRNDRYAFDAQYRYPSQNTNRGLTLRTVGALSSEKINYALIPDNARIKGDMFSQFWEGEDYSYELNRITSQQTFDPKIGEITQPLLDENLTVNENKTEFTFKKFPVSEEFTSQAYKVWIMTQYGRDYINSVQYYSYAKDQDESTKIQALNFSQLPDLDVNNLLADVISRDDDDKPVITIELPPSTLEKDNIYQAHVFSSTENYPAIDSALLTVKYKHESKLEE